MCDQVLSQYGITPPYLIRPYGNGLINSTWLVETTGGKFILQQINQKVFTWPDVLATNVRIISNYLEVQHPTYLLPTPLRNVKGEEYSMDEKNAFYRLIPFIKNSHSIDVPEKPAQAFAAAKAFGKFTRILSDLDAHELKITIPHFHNLSYRYQQLLSAIALGSPERLALASAAIAEISGYIDLVHRFEEIRKNPAFKIRVTHHDTKINNVLFEPDDKVLCVIDLDTVMPGYFISDLGDMIRTYVCPVSEEEENLSLIKIRPDFLHAILEGYLSEMENELTPAEKADLIYAGQFMTYMQAIRFLTDFLMNDIYYAVNNPLHNLKRTLNQLKLLEKLSRFAE